jgi:branched-chain amino acid transport system substrate-binding protein
LKLLRVLRRLVRLDGVRKELQMPERSATGWRRVGAATLLLAVLGLTATAATAGASGTARPGQKPFELKIGDIMPLTGDLSAFGPSLDAAARLGATAVNNALQRDGLSSTFSVQVVDTQDDQSAIPPAVEAAQKLASEGVNVIIGTLSSGSTIAVAQSVSIPDKIVTITPTSSSPAITSLKDDNLVFQMGPNDNFQARELAISIAKQIGKHALLNIGWRNDDYGNGVSSLFKTLWKQQGGRIGVTESWDPNSPSFDSIAQKLVGGNPTAYMIFDFPQTFEKLGPALVRTGKWSPQKTFVSAEFRDPSALAAIGSPATNGLRGVADSNGTTTLQNTFTAYYKQMEPGKPATGYESFAFDAVVLASLAALEADSPSGATFAKDIESLSNPPGREYTYLHLAAAIKAIEAGTKVKYEGVSSALDLSPQGAPNAARYDLWTYRNGKLKVLSTQTIH